MNERVNVMVNVAKQYADLVRAVVEANAAEPDGRTSVDPLVRPNKILDLAAGCYDGFIQEKEMYQMRKNITAARSIVGDLMFEMQFVCEVKNWDRVNWLIRVGPVPNESQNIVQIGDHVVTEYNVEDIFHAATRMHDLALG